VVAPAAEAFPSARPIEPGDLIPILAEVTTNDGRHLLLDDRDGPHQLWFTRAAIDQQSAAFLIPLDADFGTRLHAVQRLHRRLSGQRSGSLMQSAQLTALHRTRLATQLRALDGDLQGVPRREIAAVLLDPHAREIPAIEWKNATLRKQINRIVVRAKLLMNGGYLALLHGDPQRAQRFRRS
jgi:hypothetical protein